jgi:hypothetical protein
VQGLQQQLDSTHALARHQAEAMAAGDASQMNTHVSAAALHVSTGLMLSLQQFPAVNTPCVVPAVAVLHV